MASRLSHLTLSTKKQEDAADDLLASLTVIAHPTQAPPIKKKKKKGKAKNTTSIHRSRFFFKPSKSFDDELVVTQKVSEPHALTLLTEGVETRKEAYMTELPASIQPNIDTVREFFLREMGPLLLGAPAGSSQAHDVVQRTLNTEIDQRTFTQFDHMVQAGAQIKMARFVAQYLKLPRSVVAELVESVRPRKAEIIFPNIPEERRQPPAKPKAVPPIEE